MKLFEFFVYKLSFSVNVFYQLHIFLWICHWFFSLFANGFCFKCYPYFYSIFFFEPICKILLNHKKEEKEILWTNGCMKCWCVINKFHMIAHRTYSITISNLKEFSVFRVFFFKVWAFSFGINTFCSFFFEIWIILLIS